ncbi:MAG: hypothetical protein ABIV43_01145 [Candidatus Saccharimonadales bacterium]
MKLTYETGVATLVQFVVISLLNVGTQVTSVVKSCTTEGGSCLTTAFSSTGYFMLIVIWFGLLWMLGYQAQQRRSRNLCLGLVAAEFMVFVISYHNAKHFPDLLSLLTSLADIALALWVIYLAIRLLRARGRRIVTGERARRRRHSDTPQL